MSWRLILFGAWCALLIAGAGVAAYTGWSLFADADGHQRSGPHGGRSHGGHYGGFWYGPMHK